MGNTAYIFNFVTLGSQEQVHCSFINFPYVLHVAAVV